MIGEKPETQARQPIELAIRLVLLGILVIGSLIIVSPFIGIVAGSVIQNRTVTRTDYVLAYYREGERRELLPDLQAAVAWCEKELSALELRLPNVEPPA